MTPASIRLVPWGVKLQSAHTRLPWWGAVGSEALVGCSPWTLHPQPGVLPCGVTDVPCRAVLSLADTVAWPDHGPCVAHSPCGTTELCPRVRKITCPAVAMASCRQQK